MSDKAVLLTAACAWLAATSSPTATRYTKHNATILLLSALYPLGLPISADIVKTMVVNYAVNTSMTVSIKFNGGITIYVDDNDSVAITT